MTAAAELIRTVAICLLASAAIGYLAWWLHSHGPDKEG
jgi:hypothetical protein